MIGVSVSSDQNKSSNQQSQDQQAQSAQESLANKGQKRSAPEHPPATPVDQRSNSANFGECESDDTTTF